MKSKRYASFVISMFAVMVLAWSSPGASLADTASARIALFANGSYVDLDTSYNGEVLNVQAALEAKGYTVSLFSGISGADFSSALADADILYIPELENGQLAPWLSADARSVIAGFVAGGGGLIINGSGGSGDESFMNTVFGFALSSGGGVTSTRTADADGTYFAEGISSLPQNNATYSWLKSSLPTDALSLYEYDAYTTVALLEYDSGRIIFLAYDWWNAVPRGSQDGGWDDLLGRAVQEASRPSDDLSITPNENLYSTAYIDGPAIPSNMVYTLTNAGSSQLLWTASAPDEWIDVTPASGTLFPGASQEVTVAISPVVSVYPQGTYVGVVTISNAVTGVRQSRRVELHKTVRPPLRQEFKVLGLHASGANTVDHYSLTGDDRGGIAAGDSIVLYTGDSSTARYQKSDLTGGVRLNTVYDALVSDLATGQIYSLANGTTPIDRYGGTITSLVLHDPVTGLATSNTVILSASIIVGSSSGIYAGYGNMLFHTGSKAYSINFISGQVEDLGDRPSMSRKTTESWANWGIAEWFEGTNYFVYVQDYRTIVRTAAVPGGSTTVVSTFSDLSDMGTITAAPHLNRWYFQHEYSSELGSGSEVLGYADATYYIGPADTLRVVQYDDFSTSGWEGGPFTPPDKVYTLQNLSGSNVAWAASGDASWISVSPTGGVLSADAFVDVTVSVSNAAALPPGSYTDALIVSNRSTGIAQSRSVDLTVHERVLHHFAFDPISTNQLIHTPFNTVIRAMDESGEPFAGFSGSAFLSGESLADFSEESMLDGLTHETTATTDYSRGLRFSIIENMTITHLLHYWGKKISIWSDDGVLLYSMDVDASDGSWTEIELPYPIVLEGGQTYRICTYGGSGYSTLYRSYAYPNQSFGNGTVLSSCYEYGDAFPSGTYSSYTELVDFIYYLSDPVEIQPTNTAFFVDGVWTGTVSVLEAASNVVLRTTDGMGHSGRSEPFTVGYIGTLSVVLPDELDENHSAAVEGSILVDVPWSEPLAIHLVSDDESELVVPAVVSLPAGATNVSFPLTVQDDTLLDASRTVNVSAAASRYLSATASITIHDNEFAAFTLSLPQTSYEGAGSIAGALVVSQPPDQDILVQLISNNPSEVGSGSVVIPAGQTFAPFVLPVHDDSVLDGIQTATVEAYVKNWQSGYASVFVFDDETNGIDLQLPSSLKEGDGVIINGGLASVPATAVNDINLLLTCSDASELDVPAYVTIPAGTNQVAFDISVVDDADTDGMTTVSVLADAPGYIPDLSSIVIADNDPHHLLVEELSGDFPAADPVFISITARTLDGDISTIFSEPVSLTASGDRGAVRITPDVLSNIVDGAASGSVFFNNIGNDVVLVAAGGGITGTSTVFNVTGSQIAISPSSLTNTLVVADRVENHTMVISNTGNADLEFEVQEVPIYTNLVINGDFEAGNSGFTSALLYTPLANSQAKGIYTVADDSQTWNESFIPTMKDHTTGDGQMLMANGTSTGNAIVWQQDVSVVEGATYNASVWAAGLFGEFLPSLDFRVDGESIGAVATENLTWKNFSGEWTAMTNGTVTLSIIDTQFIPAFLPGNHFAVDDIIFKQAAVPLNSGGPAKGLIASYPFNGNADDASANGFDGTVAGATLTADRFGNAESAYHFNGIDNYIDLGSMGGFKTVSMWVRQAARSDFDVYFSHNNFLCFASTFRGNLRFGDSSGGLNTEVYMDDQVDQWTHVVAISDGINSRIYFNGTNVTSSSRTLEPVPEDSVNLGRYYDSHYLHGDLDDVRIYDRALTAEEVEALYTVGDSAPATNDISWVSAEPESGIIAPGSNMVVAVAFDAAGMAPGDHANASLMVTCNDVASPTNEIPASMYAVPTAPAMDAEPDATYGSSNTVSWSAVAGTVTYQCEIAVDTASAPLQQSGWQDATNHTFHSLATNQMYYYRARASVESGIGRLYGPWSGWVWSTQVPASADLDADGMPDWWEQLHFGGTGVAGVSTDSDGDGQTDRDEYVAGMDPTDPASCFMINDASMPTNGYFVVYWDAVTGRVYSVQWKASMTNVFTPMAANILYPQNSYTDTVHQSEDTGFYKVEVELE